MPTILVTNDDGIHAVGLAVLADAMRTLGDVIIVAPHQESSAIGHALTLRRPLRLDEHGPNRYAVDGTPTDCVNIAVAVLLDGRLPDLVVSGINTGWNLGDDVTYSGTVSGALEAALLGAPAIAVSLMRTRDWQFDFGPSAAIAHDLAARVLRSGLPDRDLPQRQRAQGPAEGRAGHRPGEAQPRHDDRPRVRIRAACTISGSKKARTTGCRTTTATTRRVATDTCRSRRCNRT